MSRLLDKVKYVYFCMEWGISNERAIGTNILARGVVFSALGTSIGQLKNPFLPL